jgi:hypothetical protein
MFPDECRTFAKVWDELGEKFADSKDKIIAKGSHIYIHTNHW